MTTIIEEILQQNKLKSAIINQKHDAMAKINRELDEQTRPINEFLSSVVAKYKDQVLELAKKKEIVPYTPLG